MATGKPKRPKRRNQAAGGGAGGDRGSSAELVPLLERDDPRSERRFEPRTSLATTLTVAAMSIGAVLAGAGAYGQWVRPMVLGDDAGPSKWAPWLLGAAAFVLFAVALFGRWTASAVRIGDAGVALEKGQGELERIAWYDVTGVTYENGIIAVQGPGTNIGIPVASHPDAAALFASELAIRLPARAEVLASAGLGAPSAAGAVLPLDPPQVAGLRCRKSDKTISFERDARFCGRCGELYHLASVPRRCLTCDAPLRA